MSCPRRRPAACLAILAAALSAACSGQASGEVAGLALLAAEPLACEQLAAEVDLDGATILSAELVPAGPFLAPGTAQPMLVPSVCRVVGAAPAAITFEVWLPETIWNGKFQGVGNGGMAGEIRYGSLSDAVRLGYAAVSTDTGHPETQSPFDASWARDRPDLVEDFGHRATHLAAVYGKAIATARYGQAPAQAYFIGCSKGGQQGLMEAQRYPEDYDGVIAGSPTHDWTRLFVGERLWISQATLADPESYLPPGKLRLIDNAVMAACDANDGIVDGVLDDPRQCDFDPDSLTCEAGHDDASCLTAKQAQAVRDIWRGGRTSSGEQIFPPLFPGGESEPASWGPWVTGGAPFTGLQWQATESFFKDMVFNDPDWDFRQFDFDADLELALQRVGHALDANDPDLRPLRDQGAKLIVTHGWADADVSPQSSVDYYENVMSTVGAGLTRDAAVEQTQDFFRLFLIPGMGHCRGGRGTDRFDILYALEQWVEHDVPPDRLEAARVRGGLVDRTRPLCPYPQVARWNGTGSTDDAANFSCVTE